MPTGEKVGNAQEVRLADSGASSPSYGTRGSDGDDDRSERLLTLIEDEPEDGESAP